MKINNISLIFNSKVERSLLTQAISINNKYYNLSKIYPENIDQVMREWSREILKMGGCVVKPFVFHIVYKKEKYLINFKEYSKA